MTKRYISKVRAKDSLLLLKVSPGMNAEYLSSLLKEIMYNSNNTFIRYFSTYLFDLGNVDISYTEM